MTFTSQSSVSSFGACSEVQTCFPIRPHTLHHRHTVLHRGNTRSLHTLMYARQITNYKLEERATPPPLKTRSSVLPPRCAVPLLHLLLGSCVVKRRRADAEEQPSVCLLALTAYFCLSLLPAPPHRPDLAPLFICSTLGKRD